VLSAIALTFWIGVDVALAAGTWKQARISRRQP
jgi:hypothetical protein